MNDTSKSPPKPDRKARLAQNLRANLKRRKQQEKARRDAPAQAGKNPPEKD